MGEQAYAYRSGQYSTYGDDARRERSYGTVCDEDGVCRTVIYDADGRKRTVVGSSTPYDTDTYVVETEVIERIQKPLITTDYHHGPPKKVEPVRDYGSYGSYEKYRRPSSPIGVDRRPHEVDQFLTGVQIEASRPHNRYNPQPNGAVRRPGPTIYGGGYNDYYKTSSGYGGGYSSSDNDDDYDQEESSYYKPTGHTIRPEAPNLKVHGNGGVWAAPVTTHGGGANSKLSLPTSSIDEAIDYLKAGSKTTTTSTETVRPYGYNPNSKTTTETVKPYGYNPNSKTTTETVKPYGYNPNSKTISTSSAAATTDYGANKYNNQSAWPQTTAAARTGATNTTGPVIDCYEAARRYNGKVVRS